MAINLKQFKDFPFWKFFAMHRSEFVKGLVYLFIVDLIGVLLPLLIKEAIDAVGLESGSSRAPAPENWNRLVYASLAYLGLMIFQSWGRYWWRIYLIGTSHKVAARLREDVYKHIQRLPLEKIQKLRTGDLMSRATNDIESIRMALGPGLLVSADSLMIFALILPAMFYLSWRLTLLSLIFFPVVPWLTARLGGKIDLLFESMQAKLSGMSAFAQESFGSLRLIKSLVLEPLVTRRFRELSEVYRIEGRRLSRYEALISPALGLMTNLGTFLILIIGGLDVLQGAITLGTFVAFQRFILQLSWPMEAIGWSITMTREGIAAHRRVEQVLQLDSTQETKASSQPRIETQSLLRIRSLDFQYEPKKADIEDIPYAGVSISELSLERGEKVGLVGPVGCGKTTLLNLLLRLYEPAPGTIYFDGVDVLSIRLGELRKRIASVEQNVHLFSEKVWVNILLGVQGGGHIQDAESAAIVAEVADEVKKLYLGFESVLGEKGINLSGGQKQRIALSRALARKPELLLLDDSFSAVDAEVESRIIEGLLKTTSPLSMILSTHRMSAMPRMDKIWLMDNGQIIAEGTHHSLLKSQPLYARLWTQSKNPKPSEDADTVASAQRLKEGMQG